MKRLVAFGICSHLSAVHICRQISPS